MPPALEWFLGLPHDGQAVVASVAILATAYLLSQLIR